MLRFGEVWSVLAKRESNHGSEVRWLKAEELFWDTLIYGTGEGEHGSVVLAMSFHLRHLYLEPVTSM